MSLVTLVSAAGAPGVSTTALGLALAWPRRALVVEADPDGGSPVLAGWFQGRPPHDRGVLNLAMALAYPGREGSPADWLPGALTDVVVDLPGTDVQVLTGVRSPAQAGALTALWPHLAETSGRLEEGGVDVLVDVGRLGLEHCPAALVEAADAVLLLTGSDLPALAATRGRARELTARLAATGRSEHLGLLVVGPGRPYPAREVGDLLGLPVVATLPHDPRTAQTLHLGRPARRYGRSPLTAALRSAAHAVLRLAATNRSRLGGAATPPTPLPPPPVAPVPEARPAGGGAR